MDLTEVSYRDVIAQYPTIQHFCAHYRSQGGLKRFLPHF
jgi:hypothetical protein